MRETVFRLAPAFIVDALDGSMLRLVRWMKWRGVMGQIKYRTLLQNTAEQPAKVPPVEAS
jgi:hypothetical protein